MSDFEPVLNLHGKIHTLSSSPQSQRDDAPLVLRLTSNASLPMPLRSREALLLDLVPSRSLDISGFQAVFIKQSVGDADLSVFVGDPSIPVMQLAKELSHLTSGDVVRANVTLGNLRVLYRRQSQNNSLLLTERCNSKCLMCSQPPRPHDDGYLVDELLRAIPLISPETHTLGFTGGETTLLGERFIELVRTAKNYLPNTRLDVLTNGRRLASLDFAQAVAKVGHPDLVICIPLYSDVDALHDFVVQANGAFNETVRGILNLGRVGVSIEVRVVIHQQTYSRLPNLASFIARNFPFVSHVALMGLEMTGFTRANLEALWIDPVDYQQELSEAITTLDTAGITTSIYNHQLCLLPQPLWRFAVRSISDWKNLYMPECAGCEAQSDCGGFFASATLRYSDYIRPLVLVKE